MNEAQGHINRLAEQHCTNLQIHKEPGGKFQYKDVVLPVEEFPL